jgi:hypothetical protein
MEVCTRDNKGDDDDGLNWIEGCPGSHGDKRTDHDFLIETKDAICSVDIIRKSKRALFEI